MLTYEDYDEHDAYLTEIAPLLEEAKARCDARRLPYVFAVHTRCKDFPDTVHFNTAMVAALIPFRTSTNMRAAAAVLNMQGGNHLLRALIVGASADDADATDDTPPRWTPPPLALLIAGLVLGLALGVMFL